MTTQEVRKLLAEKCDELGSQAAFAQATGISQSHVSDVLAGRREPGPAICDALGLERIATYRPIPPRSRGGKLRVSAGSALLATASQLLDATV